MDGRWHWLDNLFIERLWRSLKYEAVHPCDLADELKSRQVIGSRLSFHNACRSYAALDGSMPGMVWKGFRPPWRRRHEEGVDTPPVKG